jgi:hypothetical protein
MVTRVFPTLFLLLVVAPVAVGLVRRRERPLSLRWLLRLIGRSIVVALVVVGGLLVVFWLFVLPNTGG